MVVGEGATAQGQQAAQRVRARRNLDPPANELPA
jgi:hypothetical protein